MLNCHASWGGKTDPFAAWERSQALRWDVGVARSRKATVGKRLSAAALAFREPLVNAGWDERLSVNGVRAAPAATVGWSAQRTPLGRVVAYLIGDHPTVLVSFEGEYGTFTLAGPGAARTLLDLSRSPDPAAAVRAAADAGAVGWAASSGHCPPEALAVAARHGNPSVRLRAARRPDTPADALAGLSTDRDPRVVAAVAANAGAPDGARAFARLSG